MNEDTVELTVPLSSEALDPASEKLIAQRVFKDSSRLAQLLDSRKMQDLPDKGTALRNAHSKLAPEEVSDLVRSPFYTFWWRRLMGYLARKDSESATVWIPELSRLLSTALLLPDTDIKLHCVTDSKGTLALPTLRCALTGLACNAPVSLHPTHGGVLRIVQDDAELSVPLHTFLDGTTHPNLRRYKMIPGSKIALDAADPWVAWHLSALNAEPAEDPYPKRDLAADPGPKDRLLDHYALALQLVDEVWPALGQELRDDISYVFPFSSTLILGWADLRFRGAVFINSGSDDFVFHIERLVHEAAHIRLFGTDRVALHDNPPGHRISSPFRRDARPVTGVIHAAFVYARLIDLFVRLDNKGERGFGKRVNEVTPKFHDCVETLLSQASLTSSGHCLVEELCERVRGAIA